MFTKLFQNRENRDIAFREAVAKGLRVRRTSTHNQLIHPMYVEDVNSGDTGPDNLIYKTHFSVLYGIEEDWRA